MMAETTMIPACLMPAVALPCDNSPASIQEDAPCIISITKNNTLK